MIRSRKGQIQIVTKKSATIQFYSNSHNSQSDHWIELKFYVESLDMLSYLGLQFQVNRSSLVR